MFWCISFTKEIWREREEDIDLKFWREREEEIWNFDEAESVQWGKWHELVVSNLDA